MNQRNVFLAGLKPRELEPRLELQSLGCIGGNQVAIMGDCGCGISGCCPFLYNCMFT
jgi:hypothetical protein